MTLPYLRFSRDKRGYENTFVVHSERRRGKSRARILYWFRTPPGVKVGRSALDEDAIRLIEEHNPEVDFDWTRILKGQGSPEAPAPPRAPEHADRERRKGSTPESPSKGTRTREAGLHPSRSKPAERPKAPQPPAEELPAVDAADQDLPREPDELRERPLESGIAAEKPATPAHARLGSEGVSRLRARYAEILARISERVQDPARQEQLKAEAERLNPDTWVTDEEVRVGLETYESTLEGLRAVVGQRRRRRRGGGGGSSGSEPQGGDAQGSPEPASDDDGSYV